LIVLSELGGGGAGFVVCTELDSGALEDGGEWNAFEPRGRGVMLRDGHLSTRHCSEIRTG
jgi:hypothetical protein